MQRVMLVIVLAVLMGPLAAAQNTPAPRRGAKAIFFDPSSNVSVDTAPVTRERPRPRKVAGHEAASTVANPGLMYYLELVRPSGEVLRVTTNHIFHSGERVRIHFMTNVHGRLTIVQRQDDGSSRVLFPDARVRGGDNFIAAHEDMVVPGEKGWFRFDNHPGKERLMIFLTPSGAADRRSDDTVQAGDRLSSAKTLQLASRIERQRGSKSLVLETDDSSERPATYVVKPTSARMKATSSAMLATEIVLNHQP